jgi:predicted DNA-binding protein
MKRPEDHYAKLVQFRVSDRAKKTIAELANQRGLSEAAFLRDLIYQHIGLKKDTQP